MSTLVVGDGNGSLDSEGSECTFTPTAAILSWLIILSIDSIQMHTAYSLISDKLMYISIYEVVWQVLAWLALCR